MQHAQESTIESEAEIKADEKRNDGTDFVALAVRSAFLTFVAAVLAFSCFLAAFPYQAMKIYSGLGNADLALSSAEKYMERHADEYDAEKNVFPKPFGKYADALYFAANTSISLMNNAAKGSNVHSRDAKYYAEKVYKHASSYLTANDSVDSLYRRTLKVDEYSLLNTPRSLHPYVYSYIDDLERAKFKATYILEKDEELTTSASKVTGNWNISSGEWTFSGGRLYDGTGQQIAEEEIQKAFLLLSNLAAYVRAETDRLYYEGKFTLTPEFAAKYGSSDFRLFANSSFKSASLFGVEAYDLLIQTSGENRRLYDDVYAVVGALLEYLKANTVNAWDSVVESAEYLKYVYYLKTLKDFTLGMLNMTAVLSTGRPSGEFSESLKQNYSDYYDLYFVEPVWFYRDGQYMDTGTEMAEWYSRGPLINYVYYGKTREEIENILKPKA